MKDRYRVVVIGGGIVGSSVLYHLALRGWTDVALIERTELTAGSSWHAAGGFHAINADPHVAALQKYTIGMYPTVEAESGQDVGLQLTGGIELAGTPERLQWLKAEWAWLKTLGTDAELLTPEEIVALCPIVDPTGLTGGLFDPNEGNLDPNGATLAYAGAARARGADVVLHNRVLDLTLLPDGHWQVRTELGDVVAEHVINAAGLWAREVGRLVGVDHPLVPMMHHYLVTEDVPEVMAIEGVMPSVTDLEGFTYLQRERNGVLLGVYETTPAHWNVDGVPWDYGMELIPPEIERIAPELSIGFERFPVLNNVGIRRWVNGAFTVTPDGNPLMGPVPGVRNYWAACGVMAGFSQCAAIGLALANWLVDGDPGDDVFGMDVARFGDHARNERYLLATTAQFYARRFLIAYPNEDLPAGRPLRTTPAYDELVTDGARFDAVWGLEVPQYFARDEPAFAEQPTFERNDADRFVAAEVDAVRHAVGAYETGAYARYEVTGRGRPRVAGPPAGVHAPGSGTGPSGADAEPRGAAHGRPHRRPTRGRPLLAGRLLLPAGLAPTLVRPTDAGPRRHRAQPVRRLARVRDLRATVAGAAGVPDPDRRLARCVRLPGRATDGRGAGRAPSVSRMSLTGELGFEITVPFGAAPTAVARPARRRERVSGCGRSVTGRSTACGWRRATASGRGSSPPPTLPSMCGLDRFVDYDKPEFVGRGGGAT